MRKDLNSIIECYSCGLFVKIETKSDANQRCPRCNSKLEVHKKHSNDSLYYAISSLLLFGLLNIYPIITLNINDNELKATLIGTVSILLEQNFLFVGLVVFFYYHFSAYFEFIDNYFCIYSSKNKN